MRTIGWLAVVAAAAGACGDPQGPQQRDGVTALLEAEGRGPNPVDIKSERAALAARDQAFGQAIAAQGITAGILSGLTNDAYLLFPGEPYVQGTSAIEAIFNANFDAGSAFLWHPLFANVSVDGSVGYTFGTFEYTQNGAHGFWGKYIAFWRKQSGGAWLIQAFAPVFYLRPAGELPASFPNPEDNGRGNFTPVDLALERQALLQVDAAFSQASVDLGQAEAFRQFADPHAITLGNPDFIIGRNAIFESRKGAAPGSQLSWTPQVADVGPLGDLGFTIGNFVFRSLSNGQPVFSYGKYLTVWQKGPDGVWKFVQDGGSGNPPPAAP